MANGQIHTFYSHRTEDLVGQLLLQLTADEQFFLHQPFGQCHVVVPNSGMQRYLELQISGNFGICSHVNIGYLSGLLWQCYQRLLPQAAERTIFDERLLTFQLLSIFDDNSLCHVDLQRQLQHYQQPKQRYHFAARLARLFKHYLDERPDLAASWQRNAPHELDDHRHSPWQRQLFRQLDLGQYCRDGLQQQFHSALATLSDTSTASLPATLHIFGFHAIPPSQLADLVALSAVCEVYCYTFNPCVDYWHDIVPESLKTAVQLTDKDEAALLSVGNPLLANWGQAGKYFIEQLNEYGTTTLSDSTLPHTTLSDTTLSQVQNAIAELDDSPIGNVVENDNSISLHVTAGVRREVEVLYDNLLDLLESDDAVQPSDILVIVPKLRDYAPHIQAIFSQQAIPFSLANQTAAEADSDTQAFIAVLQTLQQNFAAQTLFECLSEQAIRQKFGLTVAHLNTLRDWFAEHRFAENYSEDESGGSLEKLLDQLLLAYVGGSSARLGARFASTTWQAEQQDALAIFARLMQQFLPFAHVGRQVKSLADWATVMQALAAAFLPENGAVAMNDRLLTWSDSLAAQSTYAVPFDVVLADLLDVLDSEELHGPFLSGGVSFCAVVPMRAIPAKVIAVLGLNDDFPAPPYKDPLDLRQVLPRWSDKNPYRESRYFFLESLMSARKQLYLSYAGVNKQTAKTEPPSSLVSDLKDFIARHSSAKLSECDYPLQGFMASENSYQRLYETDVQLIKQTDDGAATLEFPRQWRLREMVTAICTPLSFYLTRRLAVGDIETIPAPLKSHAYMGVADGLEHWQKKSLMLSAELSTASSADHVDAAVLARLADANLTAPPLIENHLSEAMTGWLEPLKSEIATWLALPNVSLSQFVSHHVGDEAVTCLLHSEHLTPNGLWQYAVGDLKPQRVMLAWLTHVLLNVVLTCPNTATEMADRLPTTWGEASRCSRFFAVSKEGELQVLAFSPFADHVAARASLNDVFTLIQATFAQPYAMQWGGLSKKKGNINAYKPLDALFYSGIATDVLRDPTALNTLFAPILTALEAHREDI